MRSWRYEVKNDKHCQGWAILHLDEGGFFGVCSDFGDYAFLWSGHGTRDFREFVCTLTHDPDYTANKLCMGRSDREEYDAEATIKSIQEHIAGEDGWSATHAKEETDLMEALRNNDITFDDWCRDTRIQEPWELHYTTVNRQALAFVKQVLPRLVEVIKKELESEKPQRCEYCGCERAITIGGLERHAENCPNFPL